MNGAKVAVVEYRELGGVCLNRGCIPSKSLIVSATHYKNMKEAEVFGIQLPGPPVVDWLAMRARKDKVVSIMTGGVASLFKSHGVTHLNGFGRLTGANSIEVINDNGEETRIKADHIIIATGSRSANIPAFPVDGKRILNSDHLLELESLPQSMLIIGAGVIGCEWACMLAMLDVKVEVVEMLDHALPMEDVNTSTILEREMKKLGIVLHTKTKVESISSGPEGLRAKLSNGKAVDANQALMAVGRAFNTEEIGLKEVGIETNRNGSILTGQDMRTNIPHIFAIGDVRGEVLLAYTAVHDGSVAVDNALGGKRTRNYVGVPSVIFTHPEVGSCGMREAEAAKEYDIAVGKFPLRALGKAHAENEIAGEIKIIGDKKTDRILGVHAIGAHATEVIHVASLAVNQGLTVTQLGNLIFGHPVISEAVMEAAHDLHGISVHLGKKRK